ncbi:MAG: hypothetical protein JWN37_769 [Candidatus Nomurabacteria bacterium]|nr:hypothetical protein [Candidatus Nomurabacteria bacterium]
MSSYFGYVTHYPSIALSVALIIVLIYTIYLHLKIHKFTSGESGISLESIIKKNIESAEQIKKTNELILEHSELLDKKVSHSIRNAKVIRYKAFESHGSNQSFSVALLNEEGNGVIITSLHSNDRINTFAKPIEKYKSSYDLTEEEIQVINESKKEHGISG